MSHTSILQFPRAVWPVALLACLAASCNRQPEVVVPRYDPEKAVAQAFSLYDTNKDARLDANELKKCPSLAEALTDLDKDGNKAIEQEELGNALRQLAEGSTGLIDQPAVVMRGGRPLAGAKLTLVPETFLGDIVKPATGVTDGNGRVTFKTEGSLDFGVQPGFYRVEVSLKDENGPERLPARYNSQTVLGRAVIFGRRGPWEIRLDE